jgi:murein L,D-transpeptidase YcbB/YkuD
MPVPSRQTAAPGTETPNALPKSTPASALVEKPSPEELYLSKDPQPTFAPDTAELTGDAAKRYLAIVEAGGWQNVPSGTKLAPGASGSGVAILKQRLAITGDLEPTASPGDTYDPSLEIAVKHFQERHGLEQTGTIGGQTLQALNVSAIVRYNQLLASAKRSRATKFPFGQRYVVVNIPSATAEAVENASVAQRYIVVVGQRDKPSPMVETKITSINLNPTWTVPASIVKKEIIPHMQKDRGYLAKQRIHILDQAGLEIDPATIDWTTNSAAALILRQDSGADNSLGTVRIDMPNKDSVYMHDTPSKRFFGSSFRFQSHGCVRVSRVQDLAAWLLENNISADLPVWSPTMISAAIAIGTRLDVRLVKPVPVAWVYLTGYATPDRVVHFRNDVYGLDNVAEIASLPPRQPAGIPTPPPAPIAPRSPTSTTAAQ